MYRYIKSRIPSNIKENIKRISLRNPYNDNLKNEKKIIVFGVPTYGNLGDQAIAYAQRKYLETNYPEYPIIEVLDIQVKTHIRFIKKILNSQDVIFIQGGGNLGNIYPEIEKEREAVITSFKENTIIQFPVSFTFSEDEVGKIEQQSSKKNYDQNKMNLNIASRESKSYQKLQELFNENNHVFVPDIVLSVNERKEYERSGVLICLRDDMEQVITDENQSHLIHKLREKFADVKITDTIVNYPVFPKERSFELNKKWDEFRKSKVVITDRLHGMIFAAITGTPCIVFDNFNQKIQKTYLDWLSEYENIRFVDVLNRFDTSEIIEIANEISDKEIDNFDITDKYEPLIKVTNLYLK